MLTVLLALPVRPLPLPVLPLVDDKAPEEGTRLRECGKDETEKAGEEGGEMSSECSASK